MREKPKTYTDLIESDIEQLNLIIQQNLVSDVALISQVAGHLIFAGGKRLRPILLLLICRALTYQGTQHYNMAAVIELIHTSTLLHDDVVDESQLRRGKATANSLFGNAASVLVGDFLYSRAFQLMVKADSMRIMRVLADTTNTIAAGEVQQLVNVGNADITVEQYIQVIRNKTAKLFEASGLIAAILSQAPADVEKACAEFGDCLGIAFQIIDDTLDYDGDTAELGKNLGDDLREGKVTLPLILTLQQLDEARRKQLKNIIVNGGSEQDLKFVSALMAETDAIVRAKKQALAYAQQAKQAVQILPPSQYKDILINLAQDLVIRHS